MLSKVLGLMGAGRQALKWGQLSVAGWDGAAGGASSPGSQHMSQTNQRKTHLLAQWLGWVQEHHLPLFLWPVYYFWLITM